MTDTGSSFSGTSEKQILFSRNREEVSRPYFVIKDTKSGPLTHDKKFDVLIISYTLFDQDPPLPLAQLVAIPYFLYESPGVEVPAHQPPFCTPKTTYRLAIAAS